MGAGEMGAAGLSATSVGFVGGWFAHPWLVVAGLLAACVPIVIHWFNRRRVRTIDWAAMRLLAGAYRRDERRVRLEDLLLLALRVALLLLAGLLVARPQFQERGWLASADPIEFVVVLDDSLSMQAIGADGTAFALAQRRILEWVESRSELGRDTLTLRLASSPEDTVLLRAPLTAARSSATIAAVERLTASDRHVDLNSVRELLRNTLEAPRTGKQVVLVVSDFRAGDWEMNSELDAKESRIPSPTNESGTSWLACDVGGSGFENLTLESLEADGVAAEGVAVTYRAVVRNWGTRTARDVTVEFQAGETAPRRALVTEIAPGATATVEWPLTIPRRNSDEPSEGLEVSATIVRDSFTSFDGAPRDDIRLEIAPGDAGIEVVLIAEETAEHSSANRVGSEPRSLELLARALAPAGEWPSGFAVKSISPQDWSAEWERGEVDRQVDVMIATDDGAGWTDAARKRLAAWIERGGTFILAPAASVDINVWNENWTRSELSSSPLRLETLHGDAGRERWREFGVIAADWEPGRRWKQWSDSPFEDVKVFRWWESRRASAGNLKSNSTDDASSRVLLSFAGNDAEPLLVERAVGRGRVWWCALPLDPDSSDWSVDPSFVLFWQEALRYAGRLGEWPRTIEAGAAIAWESPVTSVSRQASLLTATKERWALAADAGPAESGVWQFRSPLTRQAGFYTRLTSGSDGKQSATRIAVNVASGESDLRPLPDAMRQSAASFAERWLTADRPWAEQLAVTGEGWTWFAWSAMILLAVEQSFAWYVGKRRG